MNPEKRRRDDGLERDRIEMMLRYERALWQRGVTAVAGVDEAGRGPLAGPVVAAAVIFDHDVYIEGINDSKKLTEKNREIKYGEIQQRALDVGIGMVTETEIDRINILQASLKAMRMAIGRLSVRPDHILIDGNVLPEKFYPQTAIVKGDQICFSIAAASIVAKVTRDRMMIEYDTLYPEYGFARHKGYGTKKHLEAIHQFGPCPIHRKSFKTSGWTG